MKKWQIAAVVIVVIAVGVGALFGGRAWGASSSSTTSDQVPFATNGSGQGGPGDGTMPGGGNAPGDSSGTGRLGGNAISGSIISVDSTGITVQTDGGSTKIILVGDSTTISVVTEGSTSDLVTGEDVTVTGTTNDDGTVTASSIRVGDVTSSGFAPAATPSNDSDTSTN